MEYDDTLRMRDNSGALARMEVGDSIVVPINRNLTKILSEVEQRHGMKFGFKQETANRIRVWRKE